MKNTTEPPGTTVLEVVSVNAMSNSVGAGHFDSIAKDFLEESRFTKMGVKDGKMTATATVEDRTVLLELDVVPGGMTGAFALVSIGHGVRRELDRGRATYIQEEAGPSGQREIQGIGDNIRDWTFFCIPADDEDIVENDQLKNRSEQEADLRKARSAKIVLPSLPPPLPSDQDTELPQFQPRFVGETPPPNKEPKGENKEDMITNKKEAIGRDMIERIKKAVCAAFEIALDVLMDSKNHEGREGRQAAALIFREHIEPPLSMEKAATAIGLAAAGSLSYAILAAKKSMQSPVFREKFERALRLFGLKAETSDSGTTNRSEEHPKQAATVSKPQLFGAMRGSLLLALIHSNGHTSEMLAKAFETDVESIEHEVVEALRTSKGVIDPEAAQLVRFFEKLYGH